jgi:oligopeptide transport system substrate-binding protein
MKKLLSLGILLLLMNAMFGIVSAQDEIKILVTGRQMSASDIPTLDPALSEDVPSTQVISEIFVELVRINEETSAAEPGMATWEVSDDGLVYTFSITPEVPWVRYNADSGAVEQLMDDEGNPRYVTAADFAYGILRTLDPLTASPYQYVLTPWIIGGEAFGNGEGAAEDVAIEVVDDYTLRVTMANASSVNVYPFGLWITMAQPQFAIEEFGEFWIDPANIATYGPFALKEWVRGDGGSLTMIKNPFFPGSNAVPQPILDEVQFRFLDEAVQQTEFEAGNFGVAEADDTQIDRVLADPNLSAAYFTGPGTCTYYYGFNVERPPFDDVRARRAFSMAIDRAAITEDVLGAGQIPANFFALPSLNAAPTQAQFPEGGVFSNVDMAQTLWNEYLTETGQSADGFQLNIFHNESSLHATIAQAVQQMWAETLGVTVNITTADFATYLDTRGNYDVYRAAWCFDYPDAHNFYYDAAFHSDLFTENDTHWMNPEYDSLVDQAFAATDTAERIRLYAQADQILVYEDAAIAPIYYYVTNDLTAPNVIRTHSFITREYYEKWDITP